MRLQVSCEAFLVGAQILIMRFSISNIVNVDALLLGLQEFFFADVFDCWWWGRGGRRHFDFEFDSLV